MIEKKLENLESLINKAMIISKDKTESKRYTPSFRKSNQFGNSGTKPVNVKSSMDDNKGSLQKDEKEPPNYFSGTSQNNEDSRILIKFVEVFRVLGLSEPEEVVHSSSLDIVKLIREKINQENDGWNWKNFFRLKI